MAWLRIDDGFVDHERVENLSDKAFRLHVTAMCLCARKLTDGHLSTKDIKVARTLVGAGPRTVDELRTAGLWEQNGDDGLKVRDYLDYNPSAEDVREERRKAADRMRQIRSGGKK